MKKFRVVSKRAELESTVKNLRDEIARKRDVVRLKTVLMIAALFLILQIEAH